MCKKILMLIVSVSISTAVLGSECDMGPCLPENEELTTSEIVLLVPGLVLMGTNFVLAFHNGFRMSSGEPSGSGGFAGIMLGALGTVYGTACLFAEESAVMYMGIACTAAGVASLSLGFWNTRESNRRYDEGGEQGLLIDPILIDDGSGRLGPGIQVSWSF